VNSGVGEGRAGTHENDKQAFGAWFGTLCGTISDYYRFLLRVFQHMHNYSMYYTIYLKCIKE
jgi:hypothetical protein